MPTPSSRLLASRPVEAAARSVGSPLRVLAYHGVPDPGAFDRQMEHLAARYDVVSGGDVVRDPSGRGRGPKVWITFDDGDPTVIDNALPVLDRYGLPATIFVCPSVIGTDEPLWFTLVQRIVESEGAAPPAWPGGDRTKAMAHLKVIGDDERRSEVARLAASHPEVVTAGQMDLAGLRRWVDSGPGREVGNHTWDHPCLDRCRPGEAARQIEAADSWLEAHLPGQPRTFAYPNGNWSQEAEEALVAAGYAVALLFDHRVGPRHPDPLRLSRLRVSADAPLDRFKAIVSGAHALSFRLLGHHRREAASRFPPLRSGRG